jgi:ATP-dependent helicase IRC3
MINEGWLCKLRAMRLNSSTDLSDIKIQDEDFSVKELSLQVNTHARNQLIVDGWKNSLSDRQSTLIFAVDVKHIQDLKKHFTKAGIDARAVWGETPKKVNHPLQKKLTTFRNGRSSFKSFAKKNSPF